MPIAPLRPMLRTGVWLPICRSRDIRVRRAPCVLAGDIACPCRLTSAIALCTPCADELMARGSM